MTNLHTNLEQNLSKFFHLRHILRDDILTAASP